MSLAAELQRRPVFRVLVGYGVAAFTILQIIEPIMHGLHWPESVLTAVVIALAAGGPLVVAIAWLFDADDTGHRSRLGLTLVAVSVVIAAAFFGLSMRKVHAALGSLQFKGLPADARIQVSGETYPPDKPIYLREGTHEFDILAPGYETRTGTVWMKESLALVYDIALKPLVGRLLVFSNEPVTCTVTPRGGPARTEKVERDAPLKIDRPAGAMNVKCINPGGGAFERAVQIEPGQSVYIEVSFPPE